MNRINFLNNEEDKINRKISETQERAAKVQASKLRAEQKLIEDLQK